MTIGMSVTVSEIVVPSSADEDHRQDEGQRQREPIAHGAG